MQKQGTSIICMSRNNDAFLNLDNFPENGRR